MGRPSKWTDEDRAAVQLALTVNDGNVERTTRDTGIPAQTVRDWKRKWAREGPPVVVADKAVDQAGDFVAKAVAIREKALALLEERLGDIKNPKDYAVIIGILTEKINLATGLATSRTETVHSGPSPAELASAMQGLFAGAAMAAQQRAEVIIDVEVEQPKGLNP